MAEPVIEWVEVYGVLCCGHGIEFHHKRAGASAVAFLKGYNPAQRDPALKIRVALCAAAPPGCDPQQWSDVLAEVKEAVQCYLRKPGQALCSTQVFTLANA